MKLLFCLLLSLSLFSQRKAFEQTDIKIPMRDGVRLATNIFRPDSMGSYPVLLLRTPYGNNEKGRQGEYMFVEKGYAVVIQDTRGRYESEGSFDPFRFEAEDGFDTQEWIGKQPWCNGKIGTFGGSYEGLTQWLPAALGSQYLKTMFVEKSFSNTYEEMYPGGAFRIARFSPWSFEMSRPEMMKPEFLQKIEDSLYRMIPLSDHEKLLGWRISFLNDWLYHPQKDKFWAQAVMSDHSRINIPVYNMGGWFDSFLNGTLENYIRGVNSASDEKTRKSQKLYMGPWIHGSEIGKLGDLDFGETANVNMRDIMLRWFDAQLKDSVFDEPPVKIFVMGDNKWRNENDWPLARTQYKKYYFISKGKANTVNGDGLLDTVMSKNSSTNTYTYDPMDPVPNMGNMRPVDQREVEKRSDVLVYSTLALKKDVEVTGPLKVMLYASSSAINTDFTAKLVDVHSDGKAINIREGIIRASYRNGDANVSAIEPGKIYPFEIDLWATSNVFKAGHKIRVEISSSNFPMFDRNLNTHIFPATATTYVKAAQTIYTGKQYPSCIILPVIFD